MKEEGQDERKFAHILRVARIIRRMGEERKKEGRGWRKWDEWKGRRK